MAIESDLFAINVLSTDAVGTTKTRSGLSFQPKVLIAWAGPLGTTTDSVSRAHGRRSVGAATGALNRRCHMSISLDAVAASNTDDGLSDDALVVLLDTSGVRAGLLDVNSFNADGYQLIVDGQFPTTTEIFVLALGGADLTNVFLNHTTKPTTAGPVTKSVTDVGFQGDFLLTFGGYNTVINTMRTISFFQIGCAKSATEERIFAGRADDTAATMATRSYCTDGELKADCGGVGAVTNRAEFTQWTATGFDLNFLENDTTASLFAYLVLKGGRYAVGDLLTQIDTTTDIVKSGLGIGTPRAMMFFSSGKAKSTTDTSTAHDRLSIGAAVSVASQGSVGLQDDDAVADSQVTGAVEHDNVYVRVAPGATATVDGAMAVTAVADSSVTCRMTNADPDQAYVWYWAIGDNAVGGDDLATKVQLVGDGVLSLTGG